MRGRGGLVAVAIACSLLYGCTESSKSHAVAPTAPAGGSRTPSLAPPGAPSITTSTLPPSPDHSAAASVSPSVLPSGSPSVSPSGSPSEQTSPAATANGWVGAGDLVATGDRRYERYLNERFGFSVDIPAGFTEDPPPTDGDGRSFTSRSRVDKVAVWGQYNASYQTPKSTFDEEVSGSATQSVTYSSLSGDVVVISGINGDGNIYYSWEMVGPGVIYGMNWEYPPSDQPTVGPLLEHAVKTFHPGSLTMP